MPHLSLIFNCHIHYKDTSGAMDHTKPKETPLNLGGPTRSSVGTNSVLEEP